jgi:hypothetical protein
MYRRIKEWVAEKEVIGEGMTKMYEEKEVR